MFGWHLHNSLGKWLQICRPPPGICDKKIRLVGRRLLGKKLQWEKEEERKKKGSRLWQIKGSACTLLEQFAISNSFQIS